MTSDLPRQALSADRRSVPTTWQGWWWCPQQSSASVSGWFGGPKSDMSWLRSASVKSNLRKRTSSSPFLFLRGTAWVWCQFMGENTISLASAYSHDWVGKAGLCRRRSGPGNSIHRWFREGTRNVRHVSLPLVTSCDKAVDQSCHFLPFGLEKKWKIWRCAGGCANLVVPKVQGAYWVICWINFGCMSQHAAFGGRDGQQGLRGFWLQWRWLFAASRGDDFMGNSWERRTFVYGR